MVRTRSRLAPGLLQGSGFAVAVLVAQGRPQDLVPVLAHFIVSDDVERSRRFFIDVLGGRLAFSGPGGLTYVALANTDRPA